MSETHAPFDPPPAAKPTPIRISGWGLLFVAMMLMFIGVVICGIVIPRPRSLDDAMAARRYDLMGQTKAQQARQLTSTGWIDEKNRLAHIPVQKAMEQFADEQSTKASETRK